MVKSDGNLSERTIENLILNWLTWKGFYVWKTKTTANYSFKAKSYIKTSPLYRKGVADIIGILPDGRLLAIEVKTKIGRLAPHQKEFLDQISKRGGVTILAKSLEDVELGLKDYLGGNVEGNLAITKP